MSCSAAHPESNVRPLILMAPIFRVVATGGWDWGVITRDCNFRLSPDTNLPLSRPGWYTSLEIVFVVDLLFSRSRNFLFFLLSILKKENHILKFIPVPECSHFTGTKQLSQNLACTIFYRLALHCRQSREVRNPINYWRPVPRARELKIPPTSKHVEQPKQKFQLQFQFQTIDSCVRVSTWSSHADIALQLIWLQLRLRALFQKSVYAKMCVKVRWSQWTKKSAELWPPNSLFTPKKVGKFPALGPVPLAEALRNLLCERAAFLWNS